MRVIQYLSFVLVFVLAASSIEAESLAGAETVIELPQSEIPLDTTLLSFAGVASHLRSIPAPPGVETPWAEDVLDPLGIEPGSQADYYLSRMMKILESRESEKRFAPSEAALQEKEVLQAEMDAFEEDWRRGTAGYVAELCRQLAEEGLGAEEFFQFVRGYMEPRMSASFVGGDEAKAELLKKSLFFEKMLLEELEAGQ